MPRDTPTTIDLGDGWAVRQLFTLGGWRAGKLWGVTHHGRREPLVIIGPRGGRHKKWAWDNSLDAIVAAGKIMGAHGCDT